MAIPVILLALGGAKAAGVVAGAVGAKVVATSFVAGFVGGMCYSFMYHPPAGSASGSASGSGSGSAADGGSGPDDEKTFYFTFDPRNECSPARCGLKACAHRSGHHPRPCSPLSLPDDSLRADAVPITSLDSSATSATTTTGSSSSGSGSGSGGAMESVDLNGSNPWFRRSAARTRTRSCRSARSAGATSWSSGMVDAHSPVSSTGEGGGWFNKDNIIFPSSLLKGKYCS